MKRWLLLICVFAIAELGLAQSLEDLKMRLKNSAATKAADFNASRSNKEKNLTSPSKNEEEETFGGAEEEELLDEIELTSESTYQFIMEGSYLIESPSNEEAISLHFALGENAYELRGEGYKQVYDSKNKSMLTFDLANKLYVLSPAENQSFEDLGENLLRATGNTKPIQGYSCQEFEVTGEGVTLWISENMNMSPGMLVNFRTLEQQYLGLPYSTFSGLNGVVMELNSTSDAAVHLKMAELKFQFSQLNTSEYTEIK